MGAYFDHLLERLTQQGFDGSLLILKSSGGVMGVDLAKEHPEELLESGPAGGVAYAGYLADAIHEPSIILRGHGRYEF